MKILGYSERGIINSLIFSIGECPELMKKFIELIDLPKTFILGNPDNYTILLEQSFSRFGDADLIIIIHYKNPDDKKVLFIEGKVNTSSGNWKIQSQFGKFKDEKQYLEKKKYNGYSSNLFFQLYLKKLLIDNWNTINENEFAIEPKFNEKRKIGANPVVLKAFNLIKCNEAYYIGLIPTLENDIGKFKLDNQADCHFLSWEKVERFCDENNLEKVIEIFEYNKGQIYAPKFLKKKAVAATICLNDGDKKRDISKAIKRYGTSGAPSKRVGSVKRRKF